MEEVAQTFIFSRRTFYQAQWFSARIEFCFDVKLAILKLKCIQRKAAILFGLNVVDRMWPEKENKQFLFCMRKEEEEGKKEEKR